MALSAEQKILGIGILTLIGWTLYSRRKERLARQRAAGAAPTPPAEVTGFPSTPRADIQKNFKIVMPSDMVAPDVRERAAMLTARRFSVDQSKLV